MAFRTQRRKIDKNGNREYLIFPKKNADVAKLADAQVSGSCG